jgi:PKD repeat protein
MKKLILLLALLIASNFISAQSFTKKVLFLGNSYTSVNNLPLLISQVASSAGDSLIYDYHTPGGYKLANHDADTFTYNKLNQGNWDKVVLQEQSQITSFANYNLAIIDLFNNRIKSVNPCSETVLLFMTWGRKFGDAQNCATIPHVCTYDGMDSAINYTYTKAADSFKTELSPVGAVWHYLINNNSNINLYSADNSHPSLAGSYAAACTFYASIFAQDPTLITYDATLNAADALAIRNAVKLIVFDSLAKWHIGAYSPALPVANFTYYATDTNNQITFSNSSINIYQNINYIWNFGDGTTSTSYMPTHIYPAGAGTYTVTLTATKCNNSHTKSAIIYFCNHNSTITPTMQLICPSDTAFFMANSATVYQWLDGDFNPISGGTSQLVTLNNYNGPYVNLQTTVNGCTELAPVAILDYYGGVNVNNYDCIALPIQDSNNICFGDSAGFVLTNFGGPFNPAFGNIKWYKNGIQIPNAVSDTFYAKTSGTYSVNVMHNNCADLSVFNKTLSSLNFINCFPSTIQSDNYSCTISIKPNPCNGFMTITSPIETQIEILNIYGAKQRELALVKGDTKINFDELPNGVYFLKSKQYGLFKTVLFEVLK